MKFCCSAFAGNWCVHFSISGSDTSSCKRIHRAKSRRFAFGKTASAPRLLMKSKKNRPFAQQRLCRTCIQVASSPPSLPGESRRGPTANQPCGDAIVFGMQSSPGFVVVGGEEHSFAGRSGAEGGDLCGLRVQRQPRIFLLSLCRHGF
jgi:hypothetical protein